MKSENMPEAARQEWLAVLARANVDSLETAWADISPQPSIKHLRAPEIGMVMVQGRTGGTGGRFNVGEMTVSRCTLTIAPDQESMASDRLTGVGYVAGRNRRHAELMGIFDALCQCPKRGPRILKSLISSMKIEQQESRDADARKVAQTKVDFFTMARESGA